MDKKTYISGSIDKFNNNMNKIQKIYTYNNTIYHLKNNYSQRTKNINFQNRAKINDNNRIKNRKYLTDESNLNIKSKYNQKTFNKYLSMNKLYSNLDELYDYKNLNTLSGDSLYSNKEIKELKEELNKSNKMIEELKNKINILENRLKLENKINSNKILDLQKLIIEKDEELKKSKENDLKNKQLNLIQNLQNILNEKDVELNKLKEKLKNNKCVIFISNEENLCFGVPCAADSFFSEIEELLYKEYPEYRRTNNKFLSNGKEIIRNKTINENKIESGKPIVLIMPS